MKSLEQTKYIEPIAVETVSHGPIKISPQLCADFASITQQHVSRIPADFSTIRRVVGSTHNAPDSLWSHFPSKFSVQIHFIDERAAFDVPYEVALQRKKHGEIIETNPSMSAEVKFPSLNEATLAFYVHVRPSFTRYSLEPQNMWSIPKWKLYAAASIPHELAHDYEVILCRALAQSNSIGEYWHPWYIEPTALIEGFANVWAPPEPILAYKDGHRFFVSVPYLAEALLLKTQKDISAPPEELYDWFSPGFQTIPDTERYVLSEAKKNGLYLSLLGMRLGYTPKNMSQLLQETSFLILPEDKFEPTTLENANAIMNTYRYPHLLTEEAIRVAFEVAQYYYSRENDFAWCCYHAGNYKKYNPEKQIATVASIRAMNQSLFKNLLNGDSIQALMTYYDQFVQHLLKNFMYSQWTPCYPRETLIKPISVRSPRTENPYFDLIKHYWHGLI